MNPCEETLSSLKPHNCPRYIEGWAIPSISHSVGTNKLLGEKLGLAICKEYNLKDEKLQHDFTIIGSLLRSFIVIDDYAKDHNVSLKKNPVLSDWLENIKKFTLSLISPYCSSPSELWDYYEKSYHEAYYNFLPNRLFESVVKKCYLIFLIFDLMSICNNEQPHKLRKILEEYLFILQCMDDFCDMEEDLNSPKNHNIFISSLPDHLAPKVIARRNSLAQIFLPYMQQQLENMEICISNNIVQNYLKHSIIWICEKRKLLGNNLSRKHPWGNIRNFTIANGDFVNFLLLCKEGTLPENLEIRAETMHTVC